MKAFFFSLKKTKKKKNLGNDVSSFFLSKSSQCQACSDYSDHAQDCLALLCGLVSLGGLANDEHYLYPYDSCNSGSL